MLYFAIITVVLLIFYLLTSEAKVAGVSDNDVDYNNIEVVQETAKYEKVCKIIEKQVFSLCA